MVFIPPSSSGSAKKIRNVTISGTAPTANQVLTASSATNASWVAPTSSGAPTDATYITQTANGSLSAEQAIGSLATGIMKVTTTTGAITSLGDPLPVANGGTGLTGTKTRSVWMNASAFEQSEASAALTAGGIDIAPHWLLDAAAVESVVGTFVVPNDYSTGNPTVNVYFSMVSATSGNVQLHLRELSVANTESATAGGNSTEETVSVPGTAGLLKIYTFTATMTGAAANEMVRVNLRRIGSSGSDTATGDMRLYGIRFDYTASY